MKRSRPLVCTWSTHAPQSGSSPLPFPRHAHTLTATATAAGELFLFGGFVHGVASGDLYVLSTRDFSTTLLQTSGEVPGPRAGHVATLIGTTLLICGGKVAGQHVLNHDSLYLLNLGTSDLLMPSLTPAHHSFALQYRESGTALRSMVADRTVVAIIPQT
jgi:Kelch motif